MEKKKMNNRRIKTVRSRGLTWKYLRYQAVFLFLLAIAAASSCGCGRHKDDTTLRLVTYSASGAAMDAKEVIEAANQISREKIGIPAFRQDESDDGFRRVL